MPKQIERSARGMVQRALGALGEVQAYRHRVDREHAYVGWWATPAPAVEGCWCDFCAAARAGQDVYLGYSRIDAIVRADRAGDDHLEEPEAA